MCHPLSQLALYGRTSVDLHNRLPLYVFRNAYSYFYSHITLLVIPVPEVPLMMSLS